jgi:hypothetical protein
MKTYNLKEVLQEESRQLKQRRKLLFGEIAADNFESEKFGIAMSGGGIRSATVNLGVLKTLNIFKILEKADYLSTVSGGGYTGAYIQATVRELNGFENLFEESRISHLRSYGNYLIPGQGRITKLWNTVLLINGFIVSWIMSLLSPAAVLAIAYVLFKFVASISLLTIEQSLLDWNNPGNVVMNILGPALWILGGVLFVHLILNLTLNFNLNISKYLTKIETAIGLIIAGFLLVVAVITIDTGAEWEGKYMWRWIVIGVSLFFTGYLMNPNSLSFHRYYRKQLSDAFLSRSAFKNMPLQKISIPDGSSLDERDYKSPYPLINTCLNLQNPGGGEKFKGAKASDYFLLSPLFCGAKLSNYVRTSEFPGYNKMTLPAAVTISAAAVNPGMGIYSNKVLSVLMTLFNARLGFWVNNPLAEPRKGLLSLTNYVVWWPSYFFKELLAKINTDNRKLNISDGGHIENLGVYELLRRKCRLIITVDAGADPESAFADLENLSIRARNELGIDISFRKDQDPLEVIKPRPTTGYAQRRYAIADLLQVWEEFSVKGADGQPVVFKKKANQGIKSILKDANLEALVNYFYNINDPSSLKYRVDLKAERGIDIKEDKFDELHAAAVQQVSEILRSRPGSPGIEKIKLGTLVYIKSSVTPPRKLYVPEFDKNGIKNPEFDTFKYKIYHPEFPQESTADQFFDPVQWESYFQLGQHIAADVLGLKGSVTSYKRNDVDISIQDLLRHFDAEEKLFMSEGNIEGIIEAFPGSGSEPELEIAVPSNEAEVEGLRPVKEDIPQTMAEQMQFRI